MGFEKKFQEFQAIKERYDNIIRELEDQKADLESKLAFAEAHLERAIRDDLETGTRQTKNEVAKISANNDANRTKLANIRVKLDVARNMRRDKLREFLPELKKARDMAIQEAQIEIEDKTTEALEWKAKYLLFIRELNKPKRMADEADNKYKEAARTCGVEVPKDFFGLPVINVSSTYGSYPVAPLKDEIIAAFKLGKVPAFVQWYEMTGEIIWETEAHQKLWQLMEGKNR
jgi:hypothetical protein